MSKPKVLVTRAMPPTVHDRIVRSYRATTNVQDVAYDRAQLLFAAEGQDGILCCATEAFTADVIAALPESIKIIATFSVGYDHIDIEAARERNIVVTNTPDVLTEATADAAMLCLLGAARRGAEADRAVREGAWHRWTTTYLLGTQVSGKQLGIYGMGRIGQAVAQRGRGFGMAIHYHNRERLSPALERGATYHADPMELLAQSQFLSLNAPSSASTTSFLNATAIAALPDGAVVVNTARGDLIDDDALLAALDSGKVAAAGLDVFAGEPDLNPRYRSQANTFLLPHIGSATHETRDAMGFCCIDNLDAFFAGKACPNMI